MSYRKANYGDGWDAWRNAHHGRLKPYTAPVYYGPQKQYGVCLYSFCDNETAWGTRKVRCARCKQGGRQALIDRAVAKVRNELP